MKTADEAIDNYANLVAGEDHGQVDSSEVELARMQMVRAILQEHTAELRSAMREVLRISDRNHEAWNRAKAALVNLGDTWDGDTLRAAQATPAAQDDDDWWKHPKAQAVLGERARLQIILTLIGDLLDDPEYDTSAMEMEYWESIHDRVQTVARAALRARPAAL